jgi:hypothetical protein
MVKMRVPKTRCSAKTRSRNARQKAGRFHQPLDDCDKDVSDVKASDIPLTPPNPEGVWRGVIVEGVSELRNYLQQNWSESTGGLPLHGCADLYSYSEYPYTLDTYDERMQVCNVLRWRGLETRRKSLRKHLPGFSAIETACHDIIEMHFPRHVALGLAQYNGHILRQYAEADSGAGFSRHIDEADDNIWELLYLSVAVKLTDDPPSAEGSWMQVEGHQPVKYGSMAGSVIIFLSRHPHWSMRTSKAMGKVLKLVLFFSFRNVNMKLLYASIKQPSLTHQECMSSRFSTTLPWMQSSEKGSSWEKVIGEDADKLLENAMKISCKQYFQQCKATLSSTWKKNEDQERKLKLFLGKAPKFGAFSSAIYGICASVCLTIFEHLQSHTL